MSSRTQSKRKSKGIHLSFNTENVIDLEKNIHPADLATELSELPYTEILSILTQLSIDDRATVFSYLSDRCQDNLIGIMEHQYIIQLFRCLPSDERADLYNRLKDDTRKIILAALGETDSEDIQQLSSFSEDSIGAVVTSDYIYIAPSLTVIEAITHIRDNSERTESVYVIYVLDEMAHLLGVLSLRELVLADESQIIESIMHRNPIVAQVKWPKERAAELISQYDLLSLPVISDSGRMLGIVTIDDAIDIEKEYGTAQLASFGGTPSFDGVDLDIRSSSSRKLFSIRLFWLVILTVFGVVTSNFIAGQEEILSEVIVLAAFLAPIVDMGGNTGSQSATLVIRAMALGQVKLQWSDIAFIIRRELPVALALGVVISIFEAVLAYFSKGVDGGVLLTVGASMFTCTVLGGVIGGLLPFAAKKIGADPATLSSPMITSIMDLIGVFIYFGFAYVFLGDLLP